MSKPKPHLDPNGIDILLEKVSRDNCRMLGGYHDAEMSNEISRVLGCYDDIAVNAPSPDENGSDVLRTLMYQNLLLAKRVTELEACLNGE